MSIVGDPSRFFHKGGSSWRQPIPKLRNKVVYRCELHALEVGAFRKSLDELFG